jgi:hypothetical protein
MFKRHAANFSFARSRGIAPRPNEDFTHANDNLPGCRRTTPASVRRSLRLTCRWVNRNGRLECRWQVEKRDDLPIEYPEILSGDPLLLIRQGKPSRRSLNKRRDVR